MPLEVRHHGNHHLIHGNDYVASDFQVNDLVERTRELDLPVGKGYMAHWYFDGIRMAYARWRYYEPFTSEWHADLEVVHLPRRAVGLTPNFFLKAALKCCTDE